MPTARFIPLVAFMVIACALAIWITAFRQAYCFAAIMQDGSPCRFVPVRQELGHDFTLRVYFAPAHSTLPRGPLVIFVDLLSLKCAPVDEVGSVSRWLRGKLTADDSLEYVSLQEFRGLWQDR